MDLKIYYAEHLCRRDVNGDLVTVRVIENREVQNLVLH